MPICVDNCRNVDIFGDAVVMGMYGNMDRVFKIVILYQERDGIHVLKSDDVPGLMVANEDFEAVIRDLGPSVEMCFKLNRGLEVEVLGLMESFPEIDKIATAEYGAPPPAWLADATQEVVVRRR